MKILVTGGAGFVGSHLSEELVKLGHNVTIIDDYSTGSYQSIKNLPVSIYPTDICLFRRGLDHFDAVFHLAAQPFSKTKADWFYESKSIFQTNVVGTYNILRLAKKDCHFIFASSASVYGEGRDIYEEEPYNPKSAYGYSKMLAEQIIIHSPRRYTILRPGTIIGLRGRCFPNRVMWSIVHNQPAAFFRDGTILRDIIDIRDVVSALIEIMDQKVFGIFNLGSNTVTSGMQLAADASKIANKHNLKLNLKLTNFVPDDFVEKSTLSSDKLYNSLKWKPKFDLLQSLEMLFSYYYDDSEAKEPPSWENL